MAYIRFPIESNPEVLMQESYAYIKSRSPVWMEHDGNLDTWIIQVLATQASELRILATDTPDTIFRYFGNTVLGLPPNSAASARVTSTWSAIDIDGHLIPAGTVVAIRDNAGIDRGFQTLRDISILPGLSQTDEGEVEMIAMIPGTASSNIGGEDVEAELIDSLGFIESVVLASTSSGGVDAEGVDEYTDRLSEYMKGLSTRPILAEDYQRVAMGQPGVYRAVAIDGYDPSNDTYFNDKFVTIAVVDQFGQDLTDDFKNDLDTFLQSQREVNFIVNVIDPSRTQIDVNFEVVVLSNYSTSLTESTAIANIVGYLSPATWGIPKNVTGAGVQRAWEETEFVYYNEIMRVLANTLGVDHVRSLTINRSGDPPGTVDIALDLPAALTEPGIVDGTAVTL